MRLMSQANDGCYLFVLSSVPAPACACRAAFMCLCLWMVLEFGVFVKLYIWVKRCGCTCGLGEKRIGVWFRRKACMHV